MILEFKIQNFLSFKDEVILSFEATSDRTLEDYYVAKMHDGTRVLKTAMVYGANASGKSNLIVAFDFVKEFVLNVPKGKDEMTGFTPFAFDEAKNKSGTFELTFYSKMKKYVYFLEIDANKVCCEKLSFYPGVQPAVVFDRNFDVESNVSTIEFGSKIKISSKAKEEIELKTLKNMSIFMAYSQVNLSTLEIDDAFDWLKDKFFDSIDPYTSLTKFSDEHIRNNSKVKEFALNFIKEADFNISDISYKRGEEMIPEEVLKVIEILPKPDSMTDTEYEKIKKEKKVSFEKTIFEHKIIKDSKEEYHQLPSERQSRGTMRYYGLSAPFYLAIEEDGFLSIDEIGSALHPLLIIHFITEFLKKSKNAQLLFTTHNMSLLNEKDILRKDAIWFTEKKNNGSTELYSAADFSEIRKELSYYNAYKLGKFGAIPNFEK